MLFICFLFKEKSHTRGGSLIQGVRQTFQPSHTNPTTPTQPLATDSKGRVFTPLDPPISYLSWVLLALGDMSFSPPTHPLATDSIGCDILLINAGISCRRLDRLSVKLCLDGYRMRVPGTNKQTYHQLQSLIVVPLLRQSNKAVLQYAKRLDLHQFQGCDLTKATNPEKCVVGLGLRLV